MSSTASSRTFASVLALLGVLLAGCGQEPATNPAPPVPAPSPIDPKLLFHDDFDSGLSQWHIEAEQPGRISAANGVLDIDVPAGVTLWFKPRLEGPLTIEFEATAVDEGGPNDKVSDLNVFWMANNTDGRQPVFARARSGAVRRVQRSADVLRRPRRQSQHDDALSPLHRRPGAPAACALATTLRTTQYMLVPNKPQTIRLVANGKVIEYWRDGTRIFHMEDAAPYENGWFALRTTFSHLRIEHLRIRRLP